MTLDGRAVTFDELPDELAKIHLPSQRRAVIRADRNVLHGTVIAALDVLKRAGIAKIAFAVSP